MRQKWSECATLVCLLRQNRSLWQKEWCDSPNNKTRILEQNNLSSKPIHIHGPVPCPVYCIHPWHPRECPHTHRRPPALQEWPCSSGTGLQWDSLPLWVEPGRGSGGNTMQTRHWLKVAFVVNDIMLFMASAATAGTELDKFHFVFCSATKQGCWRRSAIMYSRVIYKN